MALDDDIDFLRIIPIFSRFETEALRLIAFSAETRILRAGDVLFRRGDVSDGGYVVMAGRFAFDVNDDGAPNGTMIGAGALIGAAALFAETARPATAIAREPSTVLKVSRALMSRVLDSYPQTARALREQLFQSVDEMAKGLSEVGRLLTTACKV